MKNVIKIIGICCLAILTSCNNELSLQRYFVDHQSDADFVSIDLATSLLDTNKIEFNKEEKEALESIKKINLLALPIKEDIQGKYTEEKETINTILNADSYETLMKFGSNGTKAVLKYQGNDDDIDEVIIFASNQDKGLALVRVLGDNMKPENIAKLAQAIDKGNIDIGALRDLIGNINI